MTPLLEARDLAKRYGAVQSRSARPTSSSRPGEVHALLGANGAGKSTLVKALDRRASAADSGTIVVGGKQPTIGSPARAATVGLAPVFQDPALVPDLTVAQNLRLTRTSRRRRARAARARWSSTSTSRSARGDVPLPLQRMIDLARALSRDPQLLLLDEITRRAAVRPRRARLRGHARLARAAAARCSSSRTASRR